MKIFLKKKYARISAISIVTVALCYAVMLILDQSGAIFNGFGNAFIWVINVIAPLLFGLVLTYLLFPVVNFFDKIFLRIPFLKKKSGLCRSLAIFNAFFIIILSIFILLSMVISAFTSNIHFVKPDELEGIIHDIGVQAINFYEGVRALLHNYNFEIPSFNELFTSLSSYLSSFGSSKGTNLVGGLGTGILGAFTVIKNTVINFFFAIIFCIYFLGDTKKLSDYWKKAFHAIFGDKIYKVLSIACCDLDKCFSGYIRGQFADALFMAAVVSIGLGLLGVPYAALIGVATGIGNLIPYVGPIVAYGMTILSCLIKGEFRLMVIGIVIIFILQTIDGNIINPKLLSNSVDVHPALVIVALLFGGAIGGLLGMLLSVPIAAFLRIQFERFINYREKTIPPETQLEKSKSISK
ncbi:AI-2E family transporter [Butyrivibrio sp. NC3005]|uniref:AI-2E family transporter n=1 Tax=Butyrivibrio sp. NC3005 TaxID=1280685 RepID=UPI0004036AB7|nr:AI-2E family transporter [Butyrivibrio sp. NC3005]